MECLYSTGIYSRPVNVAHYTTVMFVSSTASGKELCDNSVAKIVALWLQKTEKFDSTK